MASYPIKMLKDEKQEPFVPVVSPGAVIDASGKTLDESLSEKLGPDNLIQGNNIIIEKNKTNCTISAKLPQGLNVVDNLTTENSGEGALDAHQGKVLKDSIPSIANNLTTISDTQALSAYQGYILDNKIKNVENRPEIAVSAAEPKNKEEVWFKTSRNLFSKGNASRGYELSGETGNTVLNDYYFVSEYIRVKPGETYYISGKSSGTSNCFYSADKTFITKVPKVSGEFTVPTEGSIVFLRINGPLGDIDTVMLNVGNKSLPYEEYVQNKEILVSDGAIYSPMVIIDCGSTPWGEYTKFNNGTMICNRTYECNVDINQVWGSLYVGEDMTDRNFAQVFLEPPAVYINIEPTTSTSIIPISWRERVITTSYVQNIAVARPNTSLGVGIRVSVLAIGRWK